jgi:predicted phosphodiesterase
MVLLLGAASAALAAAPRSDAGGKGGEGRGEARMPTPAFRTEVPAQSVDLILGRPTDRAITASVLAYEEMEGYLAYSAAPGELVQRTAPRRLPRGEPVEVELGPLEPATRYHYELRGRRPAAGDYDRVLAGAFTTARPPGAGFTFTVQADPHLDFGIDPPTYVKSLRNAVAAGPDFHIDLGDTFMTDKYLAYEDARPQYLAQRYYFGLIGTGAPVFLVLGNHDGETPHKGRGEGGDAMAVWSNGMRKRYFPNPVPNAFYTGNSTPHPRAGLLQNYYAWHWGDGLFVALDPYWYSAGGRAMDNWGRTLGREQYDWLRRTLAASRAKYTFVFIHHLVGGETREGRGGAEASHFFEWGGKELDGRNTFAQRRPGWPASIHDLLVRHGGAVVFHGHDHLYAFQERDGIIYQLVPQPGHSRYDNTRSAAEYGYKSGVIQGASGIVRVAVAPDRALVEYVRAYPDAAERATRRTGAVTHHYTIKPR